MNLNWSVLKWIDTELHSALKITNFSYTFTEAFKNYSKLYAKKVRLKCLTKRMAYSDTYMENEIHD